MSSVELHVHDGNIPSNHSIPFEGIPGMASLLRPTRRITHLSVVVHNMDYEYSDVGLIIRSYPKSGGQNLGKRNCLLGNTSISLEEVSKFVTALSNGHYKKTAYHPKTNNHGHFANELCKFLLNGESIPKEYLMKK